MSEEHLFRKLSRLFRSGPTIRRKIRGVETGVAVIDPSKASTSLIFDKSVSATYAALTGNPYNSADRLARYSEFQCLAGETNIAVSTVEGGIRIDELVKRWNDGETDWHTFAYDHEKKSVVAARIINAFQTKVDRLVKVTLDDGSEIFCTSDHPFMLKDGTFKQAIELTPDTALMRFSRSSYDTAYRYVRTADGWRGEHTLVAENVAEKSIKEISDEVGEPIEVHHKNFTPLDNRAENLQIMTQCDHRSYHAELFDNANADKSFTFQTVCNAYEPGMNVTSLARKLNTSIGKVVSRLRWEGYQDYVDFVSRYENHKVVSVEWTERVEPVYDITVEKYHNFALAKQRGNSFGMQGVVFVHNSMELSAECSAALDILADEITSSDDKGRSLHVYSNNEKIKEILEHLFYDVLNVEYNLRPWARNLVKFGDFFLLTDVHPEYGVIAAHPMPVNEVEREEGFDKRDPYAVRFKWQSQNGVKTLENWQVAHFRLLAQDLFLPYGTSILDPARRVWRQLVLLEDAMLVYRIVRAPERRVFYIDVGNIPADQVPAYIEQQKNQLRTAAVVDKQNGHQDLRFNPMSVNEDYFIPTRGTDGGTKIDTLQGGQNTANVEDVAYLQKKLIASLKIPKAFLGYEEVLGSKSSLSTQDIRFSRTVNSIQKTLLAELNKIAIIHLFAHGFDNEELLDFRLQLTNPSTIALQQKLELWRAKFEIAGTVPEGYGSREFVYKSVMGLTDSEIRDIQEQQLSDRAFDAALDQAAQGVETPEGGGGGGGGGSLFSDAGDEPGGAGEEPDLGGGDLGGDEANEEPTEEPAEEPENAGTEPEEEADPEMVLLTDTDDFTPPALSELDRQSPVKQSSQLTRALYNASRRRHHGSTSTATPDFKKTVAQDSVDDDPAGFKALKADLNPVLESRHSAPTLPAEMISALGRLHTWQSTQQISSRSGTREVLLESADENSFEFELSIEDDEAL